jgi:hypothetical protein
VYVCLSSGSRARYRRDIVRTLALPPSAWIQFRYSRSWIDPAIALLLDGGAKALHSLRGATALIAYVDQSDDSREPEVVPCRIAKVIDASALGSTVTVSLELGAFAVTDDLVKFNSALQSVVGDKLPTWTDGKVSGTYWLDIGEHDLRLRRSVNLADWEQIVTELATRRDFTDEKFFYAVEGLIDVGSNTRVRARKNLYKLDPNREYDLRIYHFHPSEGDPESYLRVTSSEDAVSTAMAPEVLIDSRYDLKRLRLATSRTVSKKHGVLTLSQRRAHDDPQFEFDLPVRVRGGVAGRLGFGLALGVSLSIAPITAAYANPNLPARNQFVVAAVSLGSGLLAGLVAAFGLNRSL